ncbi:MAG: TetR/AcrR family transcriptional regulator C-terminal domain-containing protein [Myxococcaceae bacterium]|nr:TetR/AcrR family transcriptional regulator C-terminal domain-containing protein [Myxococcaceae bacterium]MCA3016300.1 TetR/AcrR family transcriptional regulator C-terminal domain-containing protein [Myxococcaceae bacterium]
MASARRAALTKRTKREPLNPERIARAALAFIDANGLEALSVRNLGAVLGVEGMALYKHYPSKEAILDAVAEQLVLELVVPAPTSGGWRRRAFGVAQDYRALARRHPNAFPLLGMRRFTTPRALALVDRVVFALMAEGLSPQQAVETYRAVANWTNGCLLNERATDRVVAAGEELSAERVPRELTALALSFQYLGHAHADELFHLGLEALLDGLERRFEASRRR